jgi:hypothetical protein
MGGFNSEVQLRAAKKQHRGGVGRLKSLNNLNSRPKSAMPYCPTRKLRRTDLTKTYVAHVLRYFFSRKIKRLIDESTCNYRSG